MLLSGGTRLFCVMENISFLRTLADGSTVRVTLTPPLINMNGTSASSLMEAYSDAGDAVNKARELLSQTGPNGRDYYDRPGAIATAQAEHYARMEKLNNVVVELQAIMEHIADNS